MTAIIIPFPQRGEPSTRRVLALDGSLWDVPHFRAQVREEFSRRDASTPPSMLPLVLSDALMHATADIVVTHLARVRPETTAADRVRYGDLVADTIRQHHTLPSIEACRDHDLRPETYWRFTVMIDRAACERYGDLVARARTELIPQTDATASRS